MKQLLIAIISFLVLPSCLTQRPEVVSGYITDIPSESAHAKQLRHNQINPRRAETMVRTYRGAYEYAPAI